MIRKPKKVRKEARLLMNVQPRYVSLVKRGANLTPWKIIKESEEMKYSETVDINKIVFSKTKFKSANEVSSYLSDKGYESFEIKDEDGSFVVYGESADSFEDVSEIETDNVVFFVGKLKQPKEDTEARGDVIDFEVQPDASPHGFSEESEKVEQVSDNTSTETIVTASEDEDEEEDEEFEDEDEEEEIDETVYASQEAAKVKEQFDAFFSEIAKDRAAIIAMNDCEKMDFASIISRRQMYDLAYGSAISTLADVVYVSLVNEDYESLNASVTQYAEFVTETWKMNRKKYGKDSETVTESEVVKESEPVSESTEEIVNESEVSAESETEVDLVAKISSLEEEIAKLSQIIAENNKAPVDNETISMQTSKVVHNENTQSLVEETEKETEKKSKELTEEQKQLFGLRR